MISQRGDACSPSAWIGTGKVCIEIAAFSHTRRSSVYTSWRPGRTACHSQSTRETEANRIADLWNASVGLHVKQNGSQFYYALACSAAYRLNKTYLKQRTNKYVATMLYIRDKKLNAVSECNNKITEHKLNRVQIIRARDMADYYQKEKDKTLF